MNKRGFLGLISWKLLGLLVALAVLGRLADGCVPHQTGYQPVWLLVGPMTMVGLAVAGVLVGFLARWTFGRKRSQPSGFSGPGAGSDPYAVFLLKNVSSGAIWVGKESVLKGASTYQFPGGGRPGPGGQGIPVKYVKKSADFRTYAEAVQAYRNALQAQPRSMPPTGGWKGRIYGGNYWVDAAPRLR